MPRLVQGMFALAVCCFTTAPLAAGRDGRQLQDFRHESEAFNRQDPYANAFRAGHYNGYLQGIIDALQGRSICFRECACEVDRIVAQYLANHPQQLDRPVVEWLVPLLESAYPCADHGSGGPRPP